MQKRNKLDGTSSNLDEIRKITQAMNEYYYVTGYDGEVEQRPPREMVSVVKQPWKLAWFKYCSPYMSRKDFSEVLGCIWNTIDRAAGDPHIHTKETVEWFLRADPKALMRKEDYQVWESLPEMVTVYRGSCAAVGTKIVKYAPSWTLDEGIARRFLRGAADNGESVGHLYKATVPKKYCLAYFSDRNGETVILNTKSTAVRNRVALIEVYSGGREMVPITTG